MCSQETIVTLLFRHRLTARVIALSASLVLLLLMHDRSIRPITASHSSVEAASTPIYFSPETNLEEVDLALIEHAQRSIDVAMYTFTDRRIAQALRRAAERGVKIRVYRDREQYEEEQRRRSTVPAILAGSPNITVKVKRSSKLMHEKSMLCDDSILRSGAGNWSVSAAHDQDNEVSVSADPAMVSAFARVFRAMWDRPDNARIQ